MPYDPRTDFLDEVYGILRATAPKYDFRQVGERGKALGLLALAEADDVQKRGEFPEWMVTGLRARIGAPLKTGQSASVATTLLVERYCAEFAPAKTDSQTHVPPRFKEMSHAIPPMRHHSGGASRHNLTNFQHVMLNDDGTVGELTRKGAELLAPLMAQAEPIHLPGHCFIGVAPGAVIYAHWILDTLPRLLQMRAAGLDLTRFDSLIFTDTRQGFHREVLDMLGIPFDRCYSRNKIGTFISCDSFEMVSAPRKDHATHPSNFALLRAFFLGDFEPPKRPRRRLYISRQRSERRRFVNGKEVGDVLLQRGFEEVFAEEHSIVEFARMMAEAECVVSPHGAGLTNLVFCQPGTRVLEIFSAHISPDYWRTSGQCGLDYHMLQGRLKDGREPTPEVIATMPRAQLNGTGILVDLDRLTHYLDTVFLV
ncbi:MAG: glycosyltransferase family 61 protein [Pseudomonadota bacterium]